jgi:hypothetical protein
MLRHKLITSQQCERDGRRPHILGFILIEQNPGSNLAAMKIGLDSQVRTNLNCFCIEQSSTLSSIDHNWHLYYNSLLEKKLIGFFVLFLQLLVYQDDQFHASIRLWHNSVLDQDGSVLLQYHLYKTFDVGSYRSSS